MSKPELRAKLAALSFSEKVRILEKLRDRSLVIAASELRRKEASDIGNLEIKDRSRPGGRSSS